MKNTQKAEKQTELQSGKNKTATDNQWISSLHIEDYERPTQDKTKTDNQWISTNKNI